MPDGSIVSEAEFHFPHTLSYSFVNTPEEQFGLDDYMGLVCDNKDESTSSKIKKQEEKQNSNNVEVEDEDEFEYAKF